jgi:predicted PurR-regulated permease PerM
MLPRGRWRWRGDEFFQDINNTLAAYIRAQLTACLLIGLICSIGFTLLGLPGGLVMGVLAGFFEFVPSRSWPVSSRCFKMGPSMLFWYCCFSEC